MFTIIYLYILVICLGIVAYFSLDRKCDRTTVLIGSLLLFLFLLLFATFRNGDVLPDYQAYCKMFASQTESKTVEQSFYFIKKILCHKEIFYIPTVFYFCVVLFILSLGRYDTDKSQCCWWLVDAFDSSDSSTKMALCSFIIFTGVYFSQFSYCLSGGVLLESF